MIKRLIGADKPADTGKPGNPFQTTQGNRLSSRDQEGRRGSEEAVPGLSVFLGKPSFPSPSAGDLRELPRVPLRGEGSCGPSA